MTSPRDRLRILQLVIAEALDLDRISAARQILESATDEQVQEVLRVLAEQVAKGSGLLFAFALFVDWSLK